MWYFKFHFGILSVRGRSHDIVLLSNELILSNSCTMVTQRVLGTDDNIFLKEIKEIQYSNLHKMKYSTLRDPVLYIKRSSTLH